jgi:hypothetical protein
MSHQLSTVSTVIDLLAVMRKGARLVRAERWELGQEYAWFTYTARLPNGDFHPVSERIAITAERRGLVTVERAP